MSSQKGRRIKKFLMSFVNNKRGQIAYVWVMVLLAIVIYSLAYYTIGAVGLYFIEATLATFSFESPWAELVQITKNVILYHPILALLGWVLWGFINSMRRDVRTWEA